MRSRSIWRRRGRGSLNGLTEAGVEVEGEHLQWTPPGLRDPRGSEKYHDQQPGQSPDQTREPQSQLDRGDLSQWFKDRNPCCKVAGLIGKDLTQLYKEDLSQLSKEDLSQLYKEDLS